MAKSSLNCCTTNVSYFLAGCAIHLIYVQREKIQKVNEKEVKYHNFLLLKDKIMKEYETYFEPIKQEKYTLIKFFYGIEGID